MTVKVPLIPREPDHPDRERLRAIGDKVRRRLAANKTVVPINAEGAELWAVADFVTPAECTGLTALIDAVAQPSRTYSGEIDTAFRTSYSGVLHPRDALVRKLQRRIDALLGLDGAHAEALQGQRYTVGQQFKPHIDWFPQNSPGWAAEGDNGGQRSFTAMAYLNDVTHGGETDFPLLDLAVPPRRGVLLLWSNADRDGVPNPLTIHAGNPVEAGFKHVVTRWYRCRATRQLS